MCKAIFTSPKRLILACMLILMLVMGLDQDGDVYAQTGYAYAYGYKPVASIRGNQAWAWTGTPLNLDYSRSVLAICKDSLCQDKNVKTGWAKGSATGGQLKMYVVYTSSGGTILTQYLDNVPLSTNTWYKFKVLYSNSASRWEAWLFDTPKWFKSGLGWTNGITAQVGGEGKNSGSWGSFDVYSYGLQYKVGSGNWTNYNYNSSVVWDGCITPAYDYGYHAWAPCVN